MTRTLFAITLAALAAAALPAAAQTTLANIRAKGHVQCGTSTGVAGFSIPDSQGKWSGFDTDFCKALGAAVFG
ncbi:MAG: amino acid ABC transporter substrate-binding protein, partial [Alphaproteobacteria bacterium]|nr:amino acid ABC transporter substrate-binding protein [Alphaproteobacteria bacterium]